MQRLHTMQTVIAWLTPKPVILCISDGVAHVQRDHDGLKSDACHDRLWEGEAVQAAPTPAIPPHTRLHKALKDDQAKEVEKISLCNVGPLPLPTLLLFAGCIQIAVLHYNADSIFAEKQLEQFKRSVVEAGIQLDPRDPLRPEGQWCWLYVLLSDVMPPFFLLWVSPAPLQRWGCGGSAPFCTLPRSNRGWGPAHWGCEGWGPAHWRCEGWGNRGLKQ